MTLRGASPAFLAPVIVARAWQAEIDMTKHTPGPWVVVDHPHTRTGSDWRQIVTNAGEFSPAYIGEGLLPDALLMADAPAMLELLRKLCLPMVSLRSDVALPMGERLEVMQEARALIAKHMEPNQ